VIGKWVSEETSGVCCKVNGTPIASRLESAWTGCALRTYVDDWNGPDHMDWGQDIKRAAD
jgi:hypothetical protein